MQLLHVTKAQYRTVHTTTILKVVRDVIAMVWLQDEDAVRAIFARLAAQRPHLQLVTGVGLYLRASFGPWVASQHGGDGTGKDSGSGLTRAQADTLLARVHAAEACLASSKAVLLG